MAYFAEIDANGVVQRVIVADQAFIDSGKVGDPANWKETFMKGDVPVEREKEIAGIGYTFDAGKGGFIEPKPFETWVLNDVTLKYEPATEKPAENAIPDKATGEWFVPEIKP